jgi:dTDP-glucose 4,6-dehydratase
MSNNNNNNNNNNPSITLLLTGGAGFIGYHVLEAALKRDYIKKVIVVDRLDYCSVQPTEFLSEQNQGKFIFEQIDVCDRSEMERILKQYQINTVIHLAALTHVDNSFGTNQMEFTRSNVFGTHVLIECCRQAQHPKIERFIHVSTDEVYGESRFERPFVETDALEPSNPYAATKAGGEAIVKSYIKSFKFPAIIARINNVYGPRQFPEKVIPKFCRQLQRGLPLTIHGQGSAMRTFIYVTDCANVLLDFYLQKCMIGEVYNMGGIDTFSVLSLADHVIKVMEEIKGNHHVNSNNNNNNNKINNGNHGITPTVRKEFVEDRLFNDRAYDISSDKLRGLGWQGPTISWKEGLRKTVEWYIEHPTFWKFESDAIVAHPRIHSINELLSFASSPVSPKMSSSQQVMLLGGTQL